jgi:NAD(P)-dependent dehydrogenase (short-subunit alcohol dehydrogenase family)
VAGSSILITGATSGIGQATARVLAPRVGRLLVHGPEPREDVVSVIDDLRARLPDGASLRYFQADYGRLAEVVRFAGEVAAAADRVDVIINNAARPGAATWTGTADGNESTLQVDYLAPVALTSSLLERLAEQDRARIVNVASATHLSATLDLDDLDLRHGYTPVAAYARAKLALVAFTCWLADHVPHPGIEAVAVHPGVIASDLLHAMFAVGGDDPESAAGVLVDVAERAGDSGTYYDERRPAEPNRAARDRRVQQRLLALTAARLSPHGVTIGRGSTDR